MMSRHRAGVRRDMVRRLLIFSPLARLLSGHEACDVAQYALTVEPPAAGACVRAKELHLIRHAEGTHNAAELAAERKGLHKKNARHAELHAQHGIAWMLLEEVSGLRYLDPPLTALGRSQAAELRAELERSDVRFDVVASSPFRRTLETATRGIPQLQAEPPSIPMVTTDLLRERVANFTCDSRLPVSGLREAFPHASYEGVSESDEPFLYDKEDGPDSAERVRARAARALEWLLALPPEQHVVAVVSHSHFLLSLTSLFQSTLGAELAHRRFRNAERRVMHLCQPSSHE